MKRDWFDTVLYATLWALFLWGLFTHSAWVAGPAAFLILLEKLDEL